MAAGINKCWSRQCPDTTESRLIHGELYHKHTGKQHGTLTLSVPLIRLFFFAGANLCLWLHATSPWDCFRSFSTLQVFWQPIVPWHKKKDIKLSHASITFHPNDTFPVFPLQAITYHDRTVCMLLQTLVMVSCAGWRHNSSMFRL